MPFAELLLTLLVATICGGLGLAAAGPRPGGLFGAVAVGFVGALTGTWLARILPLPDVVNVPLGPTTLPVVWTAFGAAALIAAAWAVDARRHHAEAH
jgi:uncharacterized membrane protein YeaQ/YmgE (transglycosylase-associated protein family)